MKTFFTMILSMCFLSICAQAQQLGSIQCDPASCQEYFGPVYSGTAEVNMYGTCNNWVGEIHVTPNVSASNCAVPVDLAAQAHVTHQCQLDDYGNLIEVDGLYGSGAAFYDSNPSNAYWQMYQEEDCEGYIDEYIPPPAPC